MVQGGERSGLVAYERDLSRHPDTGVSELGATRGTPAQELNRFLDGVRTQ